MTVLLRLGVLLTALPVKRLRPRRRLVLTSLLLLLRRWLSELTGGGSRRRFFGKHCVAEPWTAVNSYLFQHSLVLAPVPGGGNCQLHSPALHASLGHVGLRSLIVDFLALRWNLFTQF